MAFMVNLNPVLWDEVKKDTDAMAAELAKIDASASAAYYAAVKQVFAEVEAEVQVSLATPTMRKKATRALFIESTQAVAHSIHRLLGSAKSHLDDPEKAEALLDTARKMWGAYEYEVKHSDPAGHFELGQAWLEASSALGSPGLFDVGGIPTDIERFHQAVTTLQDYVSDNFGDSFSPNKTGWMYPVPVNSPTFDGFASIPAKLPPGSNLNKQLPRPRQILGMVERGVDESETPLIALGDLAFDSPYIFGEPARSLFLSCNTCHNKGTTNPNIFIPGISARKGGLDVSSSFFKPAANNGHFDALDSPDLRGIRFTSPYGRNGRFPSLREFVRNVIVNEFNGPEPDPVLLDGIIAYMNEFDFLPNRYLNGDGTLTENASAEAIAGEILFNKPFATMDNKSCASCHIPNNNFLDRQSHDIGTVGGAVEYSLDRALDTPTLLSVKNTPPYMHDGRFDTLGQVVDWFSEEHKLELSNKEQKDLVTYLETIGDGEEAFEDTLYTLEAEMEEFSFFLSSYELARDLNKLDMAGAIFQTITTEIHAHKWDVQNLDFMPVLNEMADIMDAAYGAILSNDVEKADMHVAAYRELYDANAENLK
jgi:cytochrome c peroxidase